MEVAGALPTRAVCAPRTGVQRRASIASTYVLPSLPPALLPRKGLEAQDASRPRPAITRPGLEPSGSLGIARADCRFDVAALLHKPKKACRGCTPLGLWCGVRGGGGWGAGLDGSYVFDGVGRNGRTTDVGELPTCGGPPRCWSGTHLSCLCLGPQGCRFAREARSRCAHRWVVLAVAAGSAAVARQPPPPHVTFLILRANGATRPRVASAAQHSARLSSKTVAYRALEMEGRASGMHDPSMLCALMDTGGRRAATQGGASRIVHASHRSGAAHVLCC
jgi:hypothetical protein